MLYSKLNKNILQLLYFLIPLSLITGPALPEILTGLFSILFIVYFFINKQELNLKNYIMHVMINESKELMHNGLDINIFEKQIDIAIEYFTKVEKLPILGYMVGSCEKTSGKKKF